MASGRSAAAAGAAFDDFLRAGRLASPLRVRCGSGALVGASTSAVRSS
jgi:hypothetical protein